MSRRSAWPGTSGHAAFSEAGIRDYSIYLDGIRAFGFFEADAIDPTLAETDVNARWQDAMMELVERRVANEGPSLLPEIFWRD